MSNQIISGSQPHPQPVLTEITKRNFKVVLYNKFRKMAQRIMKDRNITSEGSKVNSKRETLKEVKLIR